MNQIPTELLEGKQAAAQGKSLADNPYVIGHTKLGAPKLGAAGLAWEQGFASIGRRASPAEVAAAASVDVRNFRARPREIR